MPLPKRLHSPIMAHIIMADPISVSFRYRGPEVDTGEMNIDEVVMALQGFAGAYGKVAAHIAPEANYQLKVTAIQKSSFDLFIAAAIFLDRSGDAFETVKSVVNAARYAFQVVAEVVGLKKHTKSQPYTTRVEGTRGDVTVINAEKFELTVSMPAFEMYREKLLDSDLGKITAPLSEGRIDAAELTEEEQGIQVTIASSERGYFREPTQTSKVEMQVTGTLVSLNKETNRGTFKFGDGKTARYLFAGPNKDQFHADFSHKGPVRANAMVSFDENMAPIHLDIQSLEPMQMRLTPDFSTNT